MSNGFATLREMIEHGLSAAAITEHGRQLTRYEITVGTEAIGEGVNGYMVVLTVTPVGFAYKAQKFGIDNNTLLTPAELEARKTYFVNQAREIAEAAAGAPSLPEASSFPPGAVAQPIVEGGA